jgi:Domain of unknown function DUF11
VLPAGVTLLGVAPVQGSCSGTTTITCALGTLASGAQTSVVVTVRADLRGTLLTTGSVRAQQPDPVAANNSASQTTTVRRRS